MYQQQLQISALDWEPAGIPGVSLKVLSGVPAEGPSVVVYRFEPGSEVPLHWHTHADETAYVLEGELIENGETLGPGTALYADAGITHGPHQTTTGCTVLFSLSKRLDFNIVTPD